MPREKSRQVAGGSTAALVLAAGSGTRLKLGPKVFLECCGETLITRILRTLKPCVQRVRIAVPRGYLAAMRRMVGTEAEVIAGGSSRQETVRRLLAKSPEEILVIFDAARPFASRRLVRRVIAAARRHGSGIAHIPSPIPALLQKDGFVTGSIPSSDFMLPQSPQAYRREILQAAYRASRRSAVRQTTHELVLGLGIRLRAVMGEENNIKITTPLDWEIARHVIMPRLAGSRKVKEKK